MFIYEDVIILESESSVLKSVISFLGDLNVGDIVDYLLNGDVLED